MQRLPVRTLVAAAALALAGAAGASRLAALPKLPPGWSHAEINVTVKRVPHTLIYDRGRVLAVTATSLTLRELDGSVVTIDVSPTSRVTIAGRRAPLARVRRREIATTVRVDGGAATRVSVRIPRAVAAALTSRQARRQATLQARGGGGGG